MRKIIIIPSLVCISVLTFVVLNDDEKPLTEQPEGQTVHTSRFDQENLEKNQETNAGHKILGRKDKLAERTLAPPELEELRKKINSATSNKEFIQAILDIEHGASFNDIIPLIGELYDVWVTKDPLAALDYSDVLTSRYENNSFRLDALEKVAMRSIVDAQEWLYSNITGSEEEQDLNTLAVYSGFSVNDPIAALQYVDEIEDVYYKHRLELRALEEWAKSEPTQAMAWIENDSSFTHGISINNAYLAVVSPMIESAPLQAESIILSMKSSEQKNTLVSKYAQKLAVEDSEMAMRWAQNITDKQAYSTAVSTTLEVLANSEGKRSKALEYANKEADTELKKKFVTQAIGYIAKKNPAFAAKELSTLSFDEQKNIAISVAYSFPDDDLDSRRSWLNALPNTELREIVRNAMLQ